MKYCHYLVHNGKQWQEVNSAISAVSSKAFVRVLLMNVNILDLVVGVVSAGIDGLKRLTGVSRLLFVNCVPIAYCTELNCVASVVYVSTYEDRHDYHKLC